jgi:hypothetical protein
MMSAHQIFGAVTEGLGRGILTHFREGGSEERQVFRSALANMAAQRRLRPVFVQRKPGAEQVEWLRGALASRQGDAVAEQILQVWLLKANTGMLVEFLDAAGVAHDGSGGVDELPGSFDRDRLRTAIDAVLTNHPPEKVAVYLHTFQLQRPGGWDELAAELADRPELRLAGGPGGPVGG